MATTSDRSPPRVRADSSGLDVQAEHNQASRPSVDVQPSAPRPAASPVDVRLEQPPPVIPDGLGGAPITPAGAPRGSSGSAPSLTLDQYDALLASYRRAPAAFTEAARAGEVSVWVARRAWLEGWPPDFPPIRAVLEEERIAALAAAHTRELAAEEVARKQKAREAADRVEKARAAALKGHEEEQQTIAFARANVLLGYNANTKILSGLQDVVERVVTDHKAKITFRELVQVTRTVAMANKVTVEAAETVMKMQRLHLGQPTSILGIATSNTPRTREEIYAELEGLAETLEGSRAEPSTSPVPMRALPEGASSTADTPLDVQRDK